MPAGIKLVSSIYRLVPTLLLFGFWPVEGVSAQVSGDEAQSQEKTERVWGAFGFGTSSPGLSIVGHVIYQRGPHEFGFRASAHNDGALILFPGLADSETVSEIDLLYGRSSQSRRVHLTGMVGPSWVKRSLSPGAASGTEREGESGLGLAVIAEGSLVLLDNLGMGVQLFGNLNSVESLIGFAYVIELGRLR